MSSTPSTGPRPATDPVEKCRSCGSRLRPGATWCSLCHTAVETTPDPSRWAPLLPADQPLAELVGESVTGNAVTVGADPFDGETSPSGGESLLDAESGPATQSAGMHGGPMQAGPERRPVDPDVAAVAERLLAELAQDEARRGRQTRLAALQQRFDRLTGLSGPGSRLALAMTGGVVLLAGLVLVLTLLGLLLQL